MLEALAEIEKIQNENIQFQQMFIAHRESVGHSFQATCSGFLLFLATLTDFINTQIDRKKFLYVPKNQSTYFFFLVASSFYLFRGYKRKTKISELKHTHTHPHAHIFLCTCTSNLIYCTRKN